MAIAHNASENAPVANVGSIAYCSSGTATNFVATITPASPKVNDEVTTTFDYDLTKVITGGTATYSVTYNFLPFSPTVDQLCADQAGTVDACPLAIGHHTDISKSVWPPGLSGTVVSTIKWVDQDGADVLCLKWSVKC